MNNNLAGVRTAVLRSDNLMAGWGTAALITLVEAMCHSKACQRSIALLVTGLGHGNARLFHGLRG